MALQEISRRKPWIKNRVEEHLEKAIVEKPALGQVHGANKLAKRGLLISAARACAVSGCGTIWKPSRNG